MNNSSTSAESFIGTSFLDRYQFITVSLLGIGIIANIYALITLTRIKIIDARKPSFSTTSMLILQHQGATDMIVCIITLGFECYSLEHHVPGEHTLYGPSSAPHFINIITCHLWQSYALYWTFIFVSTWNMVFLAYERFCAVVVPRCYSYLESSAVRIASFVVLYSIGVMVSSTELFSVEYNPSTRMCTEKQLVHDNTTSWKKDMADSSDVLWLVTAFILPALFLILFNSTAVVRYRSQVNHHSSMRPKADHDSESERVNPRVKLLRAMTITSAAIATIFISANFWDAYLTLKSLIAESDDFDKNTFKQRIARLLASLNSVCDPFVYYTILPRVRREIVQNFLAVTRYCRCSKPRELNSVAV